MKHGTRVLAVFLLALALVAGALPGMGMTAFAVDDDNPPSTLTVYDGMDTSFILPVRGDYVTTYSRRQFVIPASALSAMKGSRIVAMTFYQDKYFEGNLTWGDTKFDVYLGEVEEATISQYADTSDTSKFTKVIDQGALSVHHFNMVVTFETQYQYKGGNLLVDFSHTSKDGTNSSSLNWYGKKVDGASIIGSSDSSFDEVPAAQHNFIPQVKFDYISPDTPVYTYTLTIPATLDVKNAGWNPTAGISATGKLRPEKQLAVQATSENGWRLRDGDNAIDYKLATKEGDAKATTLWQFKTLSESEPATQPMGVVVEDYSQAPWGIYTDTVTFSAKTVMAEQPLLPLLEDQAKLIVDLNYSGYFSILFTKENGSFTCKSIYKDGTIQNLIEIERDGNTIYPKDYWQTRGSGAIAWLDGDVLTIGLVHNGTDHSFSNSVRLYIVESEYSDSTWGSLSLVSVNDSGDIIGKLKKR